MSESLDIIFLDSQRLGQPGSLEEVIRVFAEAGFEIGQFHLEDKQITWNEYHGNPQIVMRQAYIARELEFRAFNSEMRLEIRQQLAWGMVKMGKEGRAWIRTSTDNTPYFWYAHNEPARYSRLYLDVGKNLYSVLRPTFGWIDFNYGLRTTHEDIETLELPTLYWANFFGPAYVKRFGRDRILSGPAWSIEELPDGGLLYVLASCPGLADDHVPIESVRTYFGVSQVR